MSNYYDISKTVVKEHEQVLLDVKDSEVERLLDAIVSAGKIEVFGMGRMGCAVKGFTMRLMHMGFQAHVVYETTCPNIGKGDLLIVNGACTAVCGLVMKLAKKAGATVCAITAHPDDKYGKMADFTVQLRGQVAPGAPNGEIPSIQPMAALFEQTLLVFEDIIIQLLMEKCNITPAMMERRHTNLDGYMDLD
ncbi:MAG: sugar isomerase [Acetivibrionales bacterium]|jgi:6-phospho-3-hexuloisomerase